MRSLRQQQAASVLQITLNGMGKRYAAYLLQQLLQEKRTSVLEDQHIGPQRLTWLTMYSIVASHHYAPTHLSFDCS